MCSSDLGKASVPTSASASAAEDKGFAGLGQIGERITFLAGRERIDHRARRNFQDAGFAVFTGAFVATAFASVAGAGVGAETEVHQVVDLGIDLEKDITAPPSVAAVGSAFRHKLFPVKSDHPVAAVPGARMDADTEIGRAHV